MNIQLSIRSGGGYYWGYLTDLFFIISGILIAIKKNQHAEISFAQFMSQRLKRLLPMTTPALIVCCILSFIYRQINGTWFLDRPVSPLAVLTQALFLYSGGVFSDTDLGINSPMWYVCILMLCYVWYWFLLWAAKKLGIPVWYLFTGIIFAGVGIITYGISLPFLNNHSQRGYIGFFTGTLLTGLYQTFHMKEKSKKISAGLAGAAVVLILWEALSEEQLLNNQLTLDFIVYPVLIGFFITSPVCSRFFAHQWCGVLGAVSFEIYIWHHAFIILVHILNTGGYLSIPYGDVTGCVVAVIVAVFGAAVYRYMEKPVKNFF